MLLRLLAKEEVICITNNIYINTLAHISGVTASISTDSLHQANHVFLDQNDTRNNSVPTIDKQLQEPIKDTSKQAKLNISSTLTSEQQTLPIVINSIVKDEQSEKAIADPSIPMINKQNIDSI